MKFEAIFSLEKPFIETRDYRRIFTSVIKSALSVYCDGKKLEEFYNGTRQKDFTWSVIFNKPSFSKDGVKLEGNDVKMVISTYDRFNTGYFLYSAFLKIKGEKLPLPKGNNISLVALRQLNHKIIEKNSCIFKTILGAPFIVREHNKENNKDKFYTKNDAGFNGKMTEALKRQALMAGFSENEVEKIKAKELSCEKNVVFNYGIYLDANVGLIEIQAQPEILQYFYQCGVMAHRSQGFGMLDLVAQTDK